MSGSVYAGEVAHAEQDKRGRRAAGGLRVLDIAPALVLLLILLAFGCQTFGLGTQSLWYDEAVTARVAGKGLDELTRWTADDIQPPLYYYVVGGWTRLAGRSEWVLRFPSVFFGVLLVPLLWALARRLFGRGSLGRRASSIAALLAALSPLYTYYAQEARMYTQLTALGLASGYCLLRAMHRPAARAGALWWAGFVLTSVAALYTHYFAAFLLLGYACYFLVAVALRRRTLPWLPASQVLGPAVLAAAAIFLIYLPWLPTMLNRLRVDRSYWQGPLKLDEALRHVAISFTTGAPETMLETEALGWLPWFGAAFLVCLAALAVHAVSEWRAAAGEAGREALPPRGQPGTSVLFLLLALGAPVAGVLALASRTPKFNPRYLMLASPAYLLLLAGGIAALLSFGALRRGSPGDTVSTRPAGGLLRWVAAACGIAILLLASAIPAGAQVQWLTGNPAFTKAQWREAAAAVRSHIQPGEAVLLVSGHAEPAWDYYAPDIPATRLPDIDVLDVQAVLGFEVGPVLQSALAGKSGAWLVSWQNQVVDPVGFVPFYLGRAGSETPVGGAFWQIGLRHWQLSPGAAYPASPQPQHGGGANFGHKIALLGWDAGPGDRELTLYWQALNTLGPHDYQVSLRFEDGSGRELAPRWDGRPAGYLFPTMRWSVGRPLFGRYAVPAELPAGEYYVTVAVYDATDPSGLDVMDIADNPAGKRVRLGPVPVGG